MREELAGGNACPTFGEECKVKGRVWAQAGTEGRTEWLRGKRFGTPRELAGGAACPTARLRVGVVAALVRGVVMGSFAEIDESFGFDRLVAGAAFGVEEAEELLEGRGVGGAAEEGTLARDGDKFLGF